MLCLHTLLTHSLCPLFSPSAALTGRKRGQVANFLLSEANLPRQPSGSPPIPCSPWNIQSPQRTQPEKSITPPRALGRSLRFKLSRGGYLTLVDGNEHAPPHDPTDNVAPWRDGPVRFRHGAIFFLPAEIHPQVSSGEQTTKERQPELHRIDRQPPRRTRNRTQPSSHRLRASDEIRHWTSDLIRLRGTASADRANLTAES